MKQLSAERGILILPLLAADCEIPVLLRAIKWADFRVDYNVGLNSLLDVLVDGTHLPLDWRLTDFVGRAKGPVALCGRSSLLTS